MSGYFPSQPPMSCPTLEKPESVKFSMARVCAEIGIGRNRIACRGPAEPLASRKPGSHHSGAASAHAIEHAVHDRERINQAEQIARLRHRHADAGPEFLIRVSDVVHLAKVDHAEERTIF